MNNLPQWVEKIVVGPASRETQKKVTDMVQAAEEKGYSIYEPLTCVSNEGGNLTYAMHFKLRKRTTPSPRIPKKVDEPNEIERTLMSCYNCQGIQQVEREKIKEAGINLEEAQQLQRMYSELRRIPKEEKNTRGMKTTFKIFVNNLRDQISIAQDYCDSVKPRFEKKEIEIPPEPNNWILQVEEKYPSFNTGLFKNSDGWRSFYNDYRNEAKEIFGL